VGAVAGNKIGGEGAKALGPHLAKLSNITELDLGCARLLVFGGLGYYVTRALVVSVVADNNIGKEGANALGPHLAKLSNVTLLKLESVCTLVFGVGVCSCCAM